MFYLNVRVFLYIEIVNSDKNTLFRTNTYEDGRVRPSSSTPITDPMKKQRKPF